MLIHGAGLILETRRLLPSDSEGLKIKTVLHRLVYALYSVAVTTPPFDVVGIGENSVDLVYRLPGALSANGKLRASAQRVMCGGQVATTLAACTALGLRSAYVGTFGNDDNGARIRQALSESNVDVSHAIVRAAPNRHAVILVNERNGDRSVAWHRDPGLALNVDELPIGLIRSARLVHVDDLDEEVSVAAARIAVGHGVAVTSDLDRITKRTAELVALSTVPIFSTHVLAALTGDEDPSRGLRQLRATHAGPLCVTLGSKGAMLLENDLLHHVPAFAVDAVDTTGAGDVFRAGFIYALLQGYKLVDVLGFAAAAAAASCTREGAMTSVPSLADVQRMLRA
jgi:sugar/nucleoside kinase (ribokinase family)